MEKIYASIQEKTSREVLIEEVDEGQPCLVCHGRCPGFQPHAWRHTCRQCKCPRRQHDVYNANNSVNVFDRLGWQRPEWEDDGLLQGYTWVPAGLASNEISDYMQQLPKDKVPRVGGPGERYRDRQLIGQLPRQDMSDTYCRSLLDPQEIKEFRIFRELRDQVAMDVGTVAKAPADATCCHCRSEICRGDLVIRASKVSEGSGSGSFWHPGCFVCCTCNELLVDLVYCLHHQELYCERHYAQTKRPRCPGCDELIFSGEFTRAMEETFHKEHLACFKCEKKLIACRYIAKEEHPYCVPCYQGLFAHNCETCSKPIGPDYKDLSYKERHWHEFCFKCSQCENSLVNQSFAPKDENIYCSECYDNNFAARCDACNNPFRGGMKKFEYKGNKWHEECFTCGDCQQPIGNKSFIPREERVICLSCYEANYAQKCNKCTEVINKGGISYKNTPFHRECFTCTNCSKTLAGEKFTSREEQPYCGDCFGELFAKRCIRCTKPITGIGGTKFISFEERHWHSDCFVCYRCEASMVGRGFLMQGEDILCPDCGRS